MAKAAERGTSCLLADSLPVLSMQPVQSFLTFVQELQALIHYINMNKATDVDWFTIKPTNKDGTHWQGKCWYVHELIKYEFDFQASETSTSSFG